MAVVDSHSNASPFAARVEDLAIDALNNGVPLAEFLDALTVGISRAFKSVEIETFDSRSAVQIARHLGALERVVFNNKVTFERQADRCNASTGTSARGTAELLASESGETARDVAGRLAVARRLEALPGAQEAFTSGKLSYKQADAISRGATDAESEAALLRVAQTQPLDELQRQAQRLAEAAASAEEQERIRERARNRRSLKVWVDPADKSMFKFFGTGPVEELPAFRARVSAAGDLAFRSARKSGERRPPQFYAYQGLMELLSAAGAPMPSSPAPSLPAHRSADTGCAPGLFGELVKSGGTAAPPADSSTLLDPSSRATRHSGAPPGSNPTVAHTPTKESPPGSAHTLDTSSPGSPDLPGSPTPKLSPPKPPRNSNVRHQVLIHVTEDAFLNAVIRKGDFCETAEGESIPLSRLYELIADENPLMRILVMSGTDVTAAASTDGRKITAEAFAIAVARDKCCANPDCRSPLNVEIDHRRPVKDGGPPTLNNLIGLCSQCHYKKTYLGWCLVGPRGSWKFVKRRANGDGGIGYPLDRDEDPGDYSS